MGFKMLLRRLSSMVLGTSSPRSGAQMRMEEDEEEEGRAVRKAAAGTNGFHWPSAADKRRLARSYEQLKQWTNGNLGDHLFRKALEYCEELKTPFFLDACDDALAASSPTWQKHAFLAQETMDMIMDLLQKCSGPELLAYHVAKFGSYHSFYTRRHILLSRHWLAIQEAWIELVEESMGRTGGLRQRRLRRLWRQFITFLLSAMEEGHQRGWKWDQSRLSLGGPSSPRCPGGSFRSVSSARGLGSSVSTSARPSFARRTSTATTISAGLSSVFANAGFNVVERVSRGRLASSPPIHLSPPDDPPLLTCSSTEELGVDNCGLLSPSLTASPSRTLSC